MPRGAKDPASPQAQAVAEQIRREMGAQRVSGRELAKAIGRSEKYVRERVSGQKALDLNDLDDMAEALGLNVIVLLENAQTTSTQQTNVVRLSDYRKTEHMTDAELVSEALADRHAALTGDDPTTEQEAPDTP